MRLLCLLALDDKCREEIYTVSLGGLEGGGTVYNNWGGEKRPRCANERRVG